MKPELGSTKVFTDDRGSFLKVFNENLFEKYLFTVRQINHVFSLEKFTLRGLHFQYGEFAEAKIFRILSGSIQLIAVDIIKDKPTYLNYYSFILENSEDYVYVPKGYATGYCTLQNQTTVLYLSDSAYIPSSENGILWNDPNLKIPWITNTPILSEKDKKWKIIKI